MGLECKHSCRQLPEPVPSRSARLEGEDLLGRQISYLAELRRQVAYGICLGLPLKEIRKGILLPASFYAWPPYGEPAAEDIEHLFREQTVPAAPFGRQGRPGQGDGPQRFKVEVVDAEHPVIRGVRDFFVADEQHTPSYDSKKVGLLLRNRSDQGTAGAAGWAYQAGKGRLCHLANGHTLESLNHPMFQRLVRNAVRWCLGVSDSR